MLSRVSTTFLFCLGALLVVRVEGYRFGAPPFTCKTMTPSHAGLPQPEETFPVTVTLSPATIWPGDTIDVTIVGNDTTFRFAGMLVTVHEVQNDESNVTLIPGFTLTDPESFKLMDCVGEGGMKQTALTHKRRLNTNRASFQWTVPSNARVGSTYAFKFTIVESFYFYWVGMRMTFTLGQPLFPLIPPPVTSPIPHGRLSGAGSASQMTSFAPGSDGSNVGGGFPQQTGQSSMNGQQGGLSLMSGQQGGLSLLSGQQAGLSSMTGQQQGGLSLMSRQLAGQSQTNGAAVTNAGQPQTGMPSLTRQQQSVSHNARRPAASVQQQPLLPPPQPATRRPQQPPPPQQFSRGRTGTPSITPGTSSQNGQPQTNFVSGTHSQPTTGTLGSSNTQGQSTSGSGSGSGKMAAWLAGWFGQP